MFRVFLWGLGNPCGALGWFLGPFGPKSVFRKPEKMVHWTPGGLSWRTPKSIEKLLKFIHVGIFLNKSVSRNTVTGPHARSLFIKAVCNYGDPVRTGALFSKNGLIAQSSQTTSNNETKSKPKASNFEAKGQQNVIDW